jgi:hypothetical protein
MLDFLDLCRSSGVVSQRDARELGKRLDLNQGGIEIEYVVSGSLRLLMCHK